jgi:hypothetical protein
MSAKKNKASRVERGQNASGGKQIQAAADQGEQQQIAQHRQLDQRLTDDRRAERKG